MTNLDRSWRNPESIVHADDATKIAALRKIADLYQESLCCLPYNRGDLVTPREGTLYGDEGAPMLVVDVQHHPEPIFSGNMQNGPAWGLKPDIRVARIDNSGDVTLIWCESYAFEPFADFAKRAAAKRVAASNAKGQAPHIDDLILTKSAA